MLKVQSRTTTAIIFVLQEYLVYKGNKNKLFIRAIKRHIQGSVVAQRRDTYLERVFRKALWNG